MSLLPSFGNMTLYAPVQACLVAITITTVWQSRSIPHDVTQSTNRPINEENTVRNLNTRPGRMSDRVSILFHLEKRWFVASIYRMSRPITVMSLAKVATMGLLLSISIREACCDQTLSQRQKDRLSFFVMHSTLIASRQRAHLAIPGTHGPSLYCLSHDKLPELS